MDAKLKELTARLMKLSEPEPGDRDDKAISECLEQLAALAESDKAGGLQETKELREQLAELKKSHEGIVDDLREVKRQRLLTPGPIVTRDPLRPGRVRMQFSCPEFAREFAEFCRKVHGHDKALTPVTDAEGAYTIPEHLDAEIQRFVETVAMARRVAGEIPLPAGVLKLNRSLTGAVVYWKAPGASATESTPTFGQTEMSAETLIALILTDLEFEEDTMIQVGNYLATEFGYSIAAEEDRVAFVGTGIVTDGGITGVLNSAFVTTVDMSAGEVDFTDLAYDHLIDLESNVWEEGLDDSQYLAHRTIIALIKKLKDTANRPIWQPASASEPTEILGYPYLRSGKMRAVAATAVSTTFMAFGNFRRGLKIGRRGGIRIDNSNIPGFRELQTYWRAFERIDMTVIGYTAAEIAANPALANPLAVLKTAAT